MSFFLSSVFRRLLSARTLEEKKPFSSSLTVAHDAVGVVVHDLGVGLVEAGREVGLGRSEADGVADALAERALVAF